uniref:Pentatricopeptide repeat domain containing protein n=2 Tax=Babesia bovis TaxID=5865 RepID=A7APH2_BABBO|eukprot:XP_001612024.1 pentatricopeptide repeat domain containing protein [Babesia bovis T2Bo]
MDDMRKKENVIDGVSYKLAIVTCAKCGYTKDALDLYEEMIRNKHPVDHGVMRALMTPLAKEGKAIECLSVFNDMKGLDKIAQDGDTFLQIQDYIKAIEACSKAHMYDDALKMYKELRSSKIYKTNTDLITHVLELFNAMGNSNDALELYAEYLEEGNTMTPYQYKLLLTTLFMTRKYNQIESIYQNMRQNATDIDQNIYQIVLESYAKTGHYKNAMEIINAMELAKMLKDSYLPFIAAAEACEQTGEWKIALQLLRRANEHNKYKSIEMYNTVLAVCATAEEWDIMVSLYLEIENVCKQTREVTNGFALSGDTLAYAIMAYFYNDEVKQAENLLQKPIKDTPLLMKIRKNLQTPQTG